MKKILTLSLLLLCGALVAPVSAQKKDKKKGKKPAPVTLTTKADSLSYASAMLFHRGLDDYLKQNFDLDSTDMADFVKGFDAFVEKRNERSQRAYMAGQSVADMMLRRFMPNVQTDLEKQHVTIDDALFIRGFRDALVNAEGPLTQQAAETYMQAMAKQAEEAEHQKVLEEGKAFLAENAKKEDVVTTPSGLQYRILRQGNGPIPKATDEVTVKYEGKLIDGTVFDSSYTRTPNTNQFRADRLIKGWTEALCLMPVGSKWELFIPQELAYGNRAAGKIPPYSTLIFTLELDDLKRDTTATQPLTPNGKPVGGKLPPGVRINPATGAPVTGPAIHPRPAK